MDNQRCICNYCENDYVCDSKRHGTSTLWNNYKNAYDASPYKVDEKKQKTLSFEPKKGGKEGEVSLVVVRYNKEACRKAIT